jgi:hypothetical protein
MKKMVEMKPDGSVVFSAESLQKMAQSVSQGSVAKEPMEMYCDRCGTILMEVPAGGWMFETVRGKCDCCWQCCGHCKCDPEFARKHRRMSEHEPHLKYRSCKSPKKEVLSYEI